MDCIWLHMVSISPFLSAPSLFQLCPISHSSLQCYLSSRVTLLPMLFYATLLPLTFSSSYHSTHYFPIAIFSKCPQNVMTQYTIVNDCIPIFLSFFLLLISFYYSVDSSHQNLHPFSLYGLWKPDLILCVNTGGSISSPNTPNMSISLTQYRQRLWSAER